MSNKEIAKIFKKTASLLELHGENQFKIRVYSNAVFNIEKQDVDLSALDQQALQELDGVGKGLAESIISLRETGSFNLLDELISKTPTGVQSMLDLKGIGPKKIRTLWQELNIETLEQLYDACTSGKLAAVKGFGAKTQETIKENLEYLMSQRGKLRYADAESHANHLWHKIKSLINDSPISFIGAFRRKEDVLSSIDLLVGQLSKNEITDALEQDDVLVVDHKQSGPFVLRGNFLDPEIKWTIRFVDSGEFESKKMLFTGSDLHLDQIRKDDISVSQFLMENQVSSEQEVYAKFDLPLIVPEMRESSHDYSLVKDGFNEDLLELTHIKGPIHNHSRYSDGKNTIRELADYCISQGYEYLGLSDHSKSAFYANGLQEFQIQKQHEEIDALNQELKPFKIFKGIESDILNDGSLDYEKDTLASFDFIVASIHSNLNMDIQKATSRLINAIENPYTTFLGHPTGRLLLKRKGYPIDHKKVIDACAENQVIIEINANPWRLDLDWRWVPYAMEKGVILSINPDAHEIEDSIICNTVFGWEEREAYPGQKPSIPGLEIRLHSIFQIESPGSIHEQKHQESSDTTLFFYR